MSTHRKITGQVLIGVLAVATVVAVVPTGYAAGAGWGTIELTGWYDTNRNGVQEPSERTVGQFEPLTFAEPVGSGSAYQVGSDARTIRVPGQNSYTISSSRYDITTPPQVVEVPENGTATVHIGLADYTVSGTVWWDNNVDGVRQPDEPPVSGIELRTDDAAVRTDENGRYRMGSFSNYTQGIWAPERYNGATPLPTPKDQHLGSLEFPSYVEQNDTDTDSDFSFTFDNRSNGPASAVGGGGQDRSGVDLGLVPGSYDQSVTVTTDRDITKLKVGNEFVMTVTVRGVSGRKAQREVDVYTGGDEMPATGMTVVRADGAGWRADIGQQNRLVTFRPAAPLAIGTTHVVKVRMRVNQQLQPYSSFVGTKLNGLDSVGQDLVTLKPRSVR